MILPQRWPADGAAPRAIRYTFACLFRGQQRPAIRSCCGLARHPPRSTMPNSLSSAAALSIRSTIFARFGDRSPKIPALTLRIDSSSVIAASDARLSFSAMSSSPHPPAVQGNKANTTEPIIRCFIAPNLQKSRQKVRVSVTLPVPATPAGLGLDHRYWPTRADKPTRHKTKKLLGHLSALRSIEFRRYRFAPADCSRT